MPYADERLQRYGVAVSFVRLRLHSCITISPIPDQILKFSFFVTSHQQIGPNLLYTRGRNRKHEYSDQPPGSSNFNIAQGTALSTAQMPATLPTTRPHPTPPPPPSFVSPLCTVTSQPPEVASETHTFWHMAVLRWPTYSLVIFSPRANS
eukprot:COSAG05_NODE_171_length_15032_cov_41.734561_1_plen_150_part_00